jgi:predicted regulator of Ras-like GTPase activity (Roadblock/LC7/MglB family)
VVASSAMPDAAQALADLTEISSQIRAAAILAPDGTVAASTFADEGRAGAFVSSARELLDAAAVLRTGGSGDDLTQLEVATGDGSVFVVRDGEHTVAATTSPEPTVGLVFYDLKTCLRTVARPDEEPPAAKAKRARKKADEDGTEADAS